MIEIKKMNMTTFCEYQDLVDELRKKVEKEEISENKVVREVVIWTMNNVYGIDMFSPDCPINIGTAYEIHRRTVQATEEINENALKN